MRLRGSCACGHVSYVIDGGLVGPVTHCHCWRCRKQSGASFGTTAGLPRGALRVVSGAGEIRHWSSSPGVRRFFAGCCGSPLWKEDDADPAELGFRLGTLDDDPGMMAQMHFLTGSQVPWISLDDGLPQQPGGPPFGERDDGPAV